MNEECMCNTIKEILSIKDQSVTSNNKVLLLNILLMYYH